MRAMVRGDLVEWCIWRTAPDLAYDDNYPAQWASEDLVRINRRLEDARILQEARKLQLAALERAGDALAHQLTMSDNAAKPFLEDWWALRYGQCTVCNPEEPVVHRNNESCEISQRSATRGDVEHQHTDFWRCSHFPSAISNSFAGLDRCKYGCTDYKLEPWHNGNSRVRQL